MKFRMPSVATDIALSWLITILASTTLIVVMIMCMCKKKKDSNSQTINERALPDIPLHELDGEAVMDNSTTVTVENNTLYYASISKPAKAKAHNPNKPHAPPPPVVSTLSNTNKTVSPTNSLPNSSGHVSNEYSSPNISHTYAEVQRQPKHPYEKLKGHSDSDHDTDEYDDPDKFRRYKRRWTNSQSDLYGPPPVPEKQNIYDEDVVESRSLHEQIDSLTNDSGNSLLSTAGQAVAGNIPSAEIPYMTPPMVQPNTVLIRTQEAATIQEAPYTIISVREPLAKVRQQTKQKGRTQDVQGKRINEGENYYSEVPEEEQMYAEICSAQELSSHLTDQQNLELPPAPPTVESLKSVAQAHSRQASIASTSSSGSGVPNVSTPAVPATSLNDMNSLYSMVDKSNKQRKTIHLGEGASTINFCETRHKIEDMYAKVRKKRVQSVRCPSELGDIGKFEGTMDDVFNPPTPLWIPHSPCGDSVSCQRSPVGSSYTPTIPSTRVLSAELAYGNEDWVEDLEPGYESVKNRLLAAIEPDYEKVRSDSEDPGYEKINRKLKDELDEPTYERVKHSTNKKLASRTGHDLEQLPSDSDSFLKNTESILDDSDPGYESVKKIQRSDSDVDPGYEAVKRQHEEEEPDYESVTPKLSGKLSMTNGFTKNHNNETSMIDNACDESEPGYESVRCTEVSLEDEEDPNYEQVHQIESDMDPDYETVGQHSKEPDYERVKHHGSDSGDPNYERIDRVECDNSEPGYETVKYISDDDSDNMGKIPISHPPRMSHSTKELNSTHIEVSIYSKYTRTSDCTELSTTSSEVVTATNTINQEEEVQNCEFRDANEIIMHETCMNGCKDIEENTSL